MSGAAESQPNKSHKQIGIIAGNGQLPTHFARSARADGCRIVAVAHRNETDPSLEQTVDEICWIRVGQLGKLIKFFRRHGITSVAMVGGINRVRHLSDVRLDLRAARVLARVRSMKDDAIMRGIADELRGEGIETVSSTVYLRDLLMPEGCITSARPTPSEERDIEIGRAALRAMSSEDIGQLVVVKNGVIVAVEAVEGSDAAIERGGKLGGPGTTVVKFAKVTQDLRFDVPVIGVKTVRIMSEVKARVLAVEAGKCIMHEPDAFLRAANAAGIAVVGIQGDGNES